MNNIRMVRGAPDGKVNAFGIGSRWDAERRRFVVMAKLSDHIIELDGESGGVLVTKLQSAAYVARHKVGVVAVCQDTSAELSEDAMRLAMMASVPASFREVMEATDVIPIVFEVGHLIEGDDASIRVQMTFAKNAEWYALLTAEEVQTFATQLLNLLAAAALNTALLEAISQDEDGGATPVTDQEVHFAAHVRHYVTNGETGMVGGTCLIHETAP